MDTFDSNAEEVDAWLEQAIDSFDFTRPGAEGSLGRDLAVAAAEGMIERGTVDHKAPDGGAWAPNEPTYAKYKSKRYSAEQPNVRTGQMLSLQSMLGDVRVGPELVTIAYGTGQPPASSFNGAELTEGDKAITDVEKAYFASRTRRFYGLDEEINERLQGVAGEALAKAIKEA